jgi:hypothetical protein
VNDPSHLHPPIRRKKGERENEEEIEGERENEEEI